MHRSHSLPEGVASRMRSRLSSDIADRMALAWARGSARHDSRGLGRRLLVEALDRGLPIEARNLA